MSLMMKNVCVCGGCGRTIETEFVYCPWCGNARMQKDNQESLDAVFQELEQKQAENRAKRLAKLEEELNALEQDLSVIALSVEMSK